MTVERSTSWLERTGLPESGRFLCRQVVKAKVWVAIAILLLLRLFSLVRLASGLLTSGW